MIRWVVRAGEEGSLLAIVNRAGGDAEAVVEGRVFIGRRRAGSIDESVREGDEIIIAPRRVPLDVPILSREGELVAVDKPAGMPTVADQSGAAHTLVAAVARAVDRDVREVHATSRLDREVSGVVLFTLSAQEAARLKRAREAGEYVRRYVAIASSTPFPARGLWDAPIGRARDPRKRAAFGRDAVDASSRFATISSVSRGALLALAPITGRTHQLRVHASHAGAPLLGDRSYGGPSRVTLDNGVVLAISRIALHAARVSVPRSHGDALVVSSGVPEALTELWGALGGDDRAWDRAIDEGLS